MAFFPNRLGQRIILCDQRLVKLRLPDGRSAEVPESSLNSGASAESWQEISRNTSTVVIEGVEIQRIDRVTMRRPNGALVTLNFKNTGP